MRFEIENSLLRPCVHDERYDEEEYEYEEEYDDEDWYADDHRQDDYVYGERG